MSFKSVKQRYPYLDLFKIGILFNALLTAWLGFYVASTTLGGPVQWHDFILLSCGLFPLFAGSAAMNHYLERDIDSKMDRTKLRPLPTQKVSPLHVLILSTVLISIGLVFLFFFVSKASFIASFLIVFLYNFVYTPLKRISWINTYVGAIPGALPPLCGWLAVLPLSSDALTLFFIFYFWQLPHFFAIAWQYKEAYTAGGLKMLSYGDDSGVRTKLHLGITSLLLFISTVIPYKNHMFSLLYAIGIVILNLFFAFFVVKFFKDNTAIKAKYVMLASIVYQPFLILLIGMDVSF